MILLALFEAFLLGQVLGEHAAPVAISTRAVNRAHRARECLDMMKILAGIVLQRLDRQPPFGPRLIKGMAEHRALGDLRIDCRRNRHCCLPVVSAALPASRRVGKPTWDGPSNRADDTNV